MKLIKFRFFLSLAVFAAAVSVAGGHVYADIRQETLIYDSLIQPVENMPITINLLMTSLVSDNISIDYGMQDRKGFLDFGKPVDLRMTTISTMSSHTQPYTVVDTTWHD